MEFADGNIKAYAFRKLYGISFIIKYGFIKSGFISAKLLQISVAKARKCF